MRRCSCLSAPVRSVRGCAARARRKLVAGTGQTCCGHSDKEGNTFSCRVGRGSGWNDNARFCRSAKRGGSLPSSGNFFLGFRLFCSAGPRD